MKSNYLRTFEEYIKNYNTIRRTLELNVLQSARSFDYEGRIGNNENIAKALQESLNNEDTRTFFIAPTGSGKTYTLLQEMNKVKAKPGEILIKLFFEPTRALATQCETIYTQFNVKSLIGNDRIKVNDLFDNKIFSIVYDKVGVIENIKTMLKDSEKRVKFLIVIDEAHDLISDQFRSECLKRIGSTLKNLENYNIIYTTATFYNCYTLDITNIIFCNPQKEVSVKVINELVTPLGQKNNDFVISSMVKELNANNKLFVRINNKDLIECIQYQLTNLGYKVFSLTSQDKGFKYEDHKIVYDNPLYESILNGDLPDFDVILVTCLLDEGISITSINGEQPNNVIPCFIYDNSNFSLNDYKQFVARFRWTLDRSILFVASHEMVAINECEIELKDIVKNKFGMYNNYYNSFVLSLKAAQMRYTNEKGEVDNNKVEEEITLLLNQRSFFGEGKNDMGGTIYYNGEINFDLNKFFNYAYTEYESQFITQDILRECKLREMFSCELKTYVNLEDNEMIKLDNFNEIKYEKSITQIKKIQNEKNDCGDDFLAYVSQEVEIEKKTNEIIESIGKINNEESKLFFKLYEYNKENLSYFLSICEDKEQMKEEVKKYLVSDLNSLTSEDIKELKNLLAGEDKNTGNEKITRILNSEIIDDLKIASNELKIDLKRFIDYITTNNANSKKISYYLKEEQAIMNNILFEKGYTCAGRSMMEQYLLINYIEKSKCGQPTFTITKEVIDQIKKELGKNWGDLKVKNFIKLVYRFQEDKKNKTITVKNLRKQHTQNN